MLHYGRPHRLAASGVAAIIGMTASGPMSPSSAPQPAAEGNLAVVATASASYVSGDTTVAALHDGYEPRSSRDWVHRSYGNWNRTGTQWVQYEWNQPVHTKKIDVYWWDDRRGVRLPAACRLLYWDGDAFVPVQGASGLGVAGDQYNTTSFDEIRTTRLRLEIDGNGEYSTGLLEWKVLDAGESPRFPPLVEAGPDRSVVVGESTYLSGSVRTPAGDAATIQFEWKKESGPGEVVFDQAGELATTATVSAPGAYVVSLTAHDGELNASSRVTVRTVAPPPTLSLQSVPTGRFMIDSPLWSGRAKALIVNWIPHCIAKISDPELKEGGINNFIDAANKLAGRPHGEHRGYVFSNAWVYNTLEAICIALGIDPQGDRDIIAAQDGMRATLEDWIPKILAAQEPDGYLQTAYTLSDRERWSPRHRGDHEGYVAGYFLEAAIAHHRLTGGADRRLYDAARRLADCWDAQIGPPPLQAWYDGHQGMEIAILRFGRYVNEVEGEDEGEPYLNLAKFLLDCRGDGSEYDQSHVPVTRQYEAVGHAVRAVYSYAAMAEVALESSDADYRSAVESLWDNIVNRKYYATGGVGSGESSEGFGPDYSLRNEAYCESCSSCGLIYFQHAMNRISGHSRYADLYEETLYNALLGSMDLEGNNFYYQNPLDSGRPRYDWHVCPCCVGNIPRTLLMLPTWTYLKDDDGVYVNLFIGSSVKIANVAGTDVELKQTTDYPWRGEVSITVNPAESKRFAVRIRSPQKDVSELYSASPSADGITSISVNGKSVEPRLERGYVVLERVWKAGDRIELELPMTVQRVKGIENIEATRGKVALRYGPLMYNVERKDQDITQVLDPSVELRPEWNGDLLDGVMAITGAWSGGDPLLAIPNYARNNRFSESQPAERSGERRGPRSIVWIRDE